MLVLHKFGLLLFTFLVPLGTAQSQEQPRFLKPPLTGVTEITKVANKKIAMEGSILQLKDGTLMLAQGKRSFLSTDGGKTWSERQDWNCPIEVQALIWLRSGSLGALGFTGDDHYGFQGVFTRSEDDGKTWGPVLSVPLATGTYPMPNSLIQLSKGRLLLPGAMMLSGQHADKVQPLGIGLSGAWGKWRGKLFKTESEGHMPQVDITFVYYSDDEGETWKRYDRYNSIMSWIDTTGEPTGKNGVTDFSEPFAAETKDGRVLMFGRSPLGRVPYSVSEDGGSSWSAVRPTKLAGSYSPAILKRIPKTGDLLCVWNQQSREEIQRGYRRGRLSAAISKDSGKTWTNFRTLELSEGLKDVAQIAPELPLEWVKARKDVGTLPDGWAVFTYPNVDIVGDQVFIRYIRGTPLQGVSDQGLNNLDLVLRVYPLEYFEKQ